MDIPWPRAKVLGVSWMIWFFGISDDFRLAHAAVSETVCGDRGSAAIHARRKCRRENAGGADFDRYAAGRPLSAYGYTKIRTPNIDSSAKRERFTCGSIRRSR
jgi:hypothetical protein